MAVTPQEQKEATKKAMLLLEHMDRTEKGLSDRLRQAGFSAEAVEGAMNYVRSYGYLNDERYAENYIAFRMESKSRQKILQEIALRSSGGNALAVFHIFIQPVKNALLGLGIAQMRVAVKGNIAPDVVHQCAGFLRQIQKV